MVVEPHPFPERALWRVGFPIAATLLAVAVFTVMLGGGVERPRLVVVVVLVALQVVLGGGRAWSARRSARLPDLPLRWQQFVTVWSGFAGGMFLLGADHSRTSAAMVVGAGLIMAVLVAGADLLLDRRPRPRSSQDP